MLSEELNGRLLTEREARSLLRAFFRHRHDCDGRPLRAAAVFTKDNLEVVRSIELLDAVDIIYQAVRDFCYPGDPAELFLSLQRRCHEAGIPKEYSGGIAIVYLQVCMGWQF